MPTTRQIKKKPSPTENGGDDAAAAAASTKRRLDFGSRLPDPAASSSSSIATEEKKTPRKRPTHKSAVTPSPNDKKQQQATTESKRSASSAFFSPASSVQTNKKRKSAVTPEAAASAATAAQQQEKEVSTPKDDDLFVPTYIHKNLGYDRKGQRKGLSANTKQCFQLIQEYYVIPNNFEQCRYSENNGGPISGTCFEERVIQAYSLGKLQVKPKYTNNNTESMVDNNDVDGRQCLSSTTKTVTIKICSSCADVGHMRDDCPVLL